MPAAEPSHDFTSPNWAPLHLVVAADQAEMFLWMHVYIWADGIVRHEAPYTGWDGRTHLRPVVAGR